MGLGPACCLVHWRPFPFGSSSSWGEGPSLLPVDSSSQLSNLTGFALVFASFHLLDLDMLTCMKTQYLLI